MKVFQATRPVLTPRQRQVRDGLLRGLSRKQLARELGISVDTVSAHIKALYRAYGVSGQLELLLLLGTPKSRKPRSGYLPGRDADRSPWKDRGGAGK